MTTHLAHPSLLGFAALAALAVLVWPARRSRRHLRPTGPHGPSGSLGPRSRWVVGGWDAPGWRHRQRQSLALDDLADLVDVLVPPLQAGVATAEAVRTASRAMCDRPALSRLTRALASAATQGLPLGPVWGEEAARGDHPVQRFLARAWSLSEETGVPLAVSLTAAGRVLRTRQAAEQALAAASAGARASMALLALLPASGPAIGLLFGLSPIDLYAGSPAAAGSLAIGVLLGLAGWVWSRAILRRALQPEVLS